MNELHILQSQPGFARDGTLLDADSYTDGEWVRFFKGRPKKIGGYRAMTRTADGPVRSLLVDSRGGVNSLHSFSQWGVRRLEFDDNGSGGSLEDRTPGSYIVDPRNTWSHAIMTSSTGGSYAALLAACAPDLDQLDSDEPGFLYSGDLKRADPLVVVEDANGPVQVSGGVTVLGPIAVAYGSNGLIKNSDLNNFSSSGWTTGGSSFANEANPIGTKIVYGAPVRGGAQAPAGLFWGLDSLVRMSLSGNAQTLWTYDILTSPTSILSKKCVVEHDGKFFWIGTDRFLMYNGVVQEVPNVQNLNWFFDSINMAARNKVWGTKISRWGEIWWFFPMGVSTECNAAIIYNYRENVWYDARKLRSAGGAVQVFPYPIWAGAEDAQATKLLSVGDRAVLTVAATTGTDTLEVDDASLIQMGDTVRGPGVPPGTTVVNVVGAVVTLSDNLTADSDIGVAFDFSHSTTPFLVGETVTGDTSGATGTVVRSQDTQVNLVDVVGTFDPAGEDLTGSLGGSSASNPGELQDQSLEAIYQQEFGLDKIVGDQVSAVRSSVTSKSFGFAIGSPFADVPKAAGVATRVTRVEPDYEQRETLQIEILGRDFGTQEPTLVASGELPAGTPFLDLRGAVGRILQLRVVSNRAGGDYFQGQVALALEPFDERSQVST